ncbi:MAG: CopG family transcriptional regulator [Cyanobacteria bacterium J06576_12]
MTRKKMTDKKDELTSSETSFLKGDTGDTKTKVPTQAKKSAPPAIPNDIMSQILAPATTKEPTTRFTADLPDSLHRRLTIAAAMSGKKKVDIVRELLDASLPSLPQ